MHNASLHCTHVQVLTAGMFETLQGLGGAEAKSMAFRDQALQFRESQPLAFHS
jgi:hypothetical protein